GRCRGGRRAADCHSPYWRYIYKRQHRINRTCGGSSSRRYFFCTAVLLSNIGQWCRKPLAGNDKPFLFAVYYLSYPFNNGISYVKGIIQKEGRTRTGFRY